MITADKIDFDRVKKPKTEKPTHKTFNIDREKIDENLRLLDKAQQYWDALLSFRETRRRTRNYSMGFQWEDIITDPDSGDNITESDYIMRNGKVPLKQNIIGQLANSYLGQYRSNPSSAIVIARQRDRQSEAEMMSVSLEASLQANQMEDLDADSVREYITSGMPLQKISWGYWKERDQKDVIISNINPNNIFFNTDISDKRGKDLTIIGERMECSIEDVISTFADTKEKEAEIREIYNRSYNDSIYAPGEIGKSRFDNVSFLYPSEDNRVMLFEVWYLEGRWMKEVHDFGDGTITVTDREVEEMEAENQMRLQMGMEQGIPEEEIPLLEWKDLFESVWRVKWISPWGDCFMEMDTPYLHDEHPYVFHPYPLQDGEIWGFLSEFIDQQRYINRLITLWDFVISASAKGVLMMPENMLPKGMSPEEFSAEYRKFNGVIYYKPVNQTAVPHQISANSTNIGIQEMLTLQLKLINDISGIQGALQGQQPRAGTPASMYAMQSQNSSLNILDKMKHFDSFLRKRNFKVLKLLKQFVEEPRYNSIVGKSYSEEAKWYDPKRVKDLEFDVQITKGKDAPAFRLMMDDLLMQLLQGQFIDIKMYLENTSAPFADKILEQITQREQQMAQGQMPGQIPPELMAQIGANPEFMNMINKPK